MKANHLPILSLIFAVILLLLPCAVQGEGVILPGLSPLDAYEYMVAAFDVADYDKARVILEDNRLDELNVKDSKQYHIYLTALAYMEQDEFELAAQLFYSLFSGSESFYDSSVVYHYCLGRVEETAENYAAAVEHYSAAATCRDAIARVKSCMEKNAAALSTSANEKYSTAIEKQDVAMLTEAKQMFLDIGDNLMVEQCEKDIEYFGKLQRYQNAAAQLQLALESGNQQEMQTILDTFTALGDFEDSQKMAERIQKELANLKRLLTITAEQVAHNSIGIGILDSAAEVTYEITYAPANMKAAQTIIAEAETAVLEGLLPNTEYMIKVSDAQVPQHYAAVSVRTRTAPAYSADGFFVIRTVLLSLNRSYLSLYPLEELLTNKQQVFEYVDDNTLYLKDTSGMPQSKVYCYSVTYQQQAAAEEAVEIQWMLRTKDAGVYVSPVYHENQIPAVGRLSCELSVLLNQLYEESGVWPTGVCSVELYLNGCLAATGTLNIE